MTISGDGHYIRGTLSEFELGRAVLGQAVDVRVPGTGKAFEGTVVDIGNYPVNRGGAGAGSLGVSLYPFTVSLPEDTDLDEGERVFMRLRYVGDEERFFIDRAFVREDMDGSSYVMAAGFDGKLEKRVVSTGRILWSSYIEICRGLQPDDYIAFPYGKYVSEGVRTRMSDFGNYDDPAAPSIFTENMPLGSISYKLYDSGPPESKEGENKLDARLVLRRCLSCLSYS